MKKILAAIIVALLLGGTAFAFSYWDENLSEIDNVTDITVGSGTSIVVSAVAQPNAGDTLVPTGVIMGTNDVDSVVLTYNVKLDKAGASGSLTIVASNLLVGGGADTYDLVNIVITPSPSTVSDTNVLYTVTVTIDEPANATEYAAVAGQAITFDLTFTAAA